MKKNILYTAFIGAALWLAGAPLMAQTRSYEGEIEVVPIRLEQKGDLLYVDIDFVLKQVRLKSASGVNLIPQLAGRNDTLNLPEVWIKGRDEYLAYERKLSLASKKELEEMPSPYQVVKDYKRNSDTIAYRYTLPYQPWMAEAGLLLQRDECGCGETALMAMVPVVEKITLDIPPKPYVVTPHIAYIQPVAEAVKNREVQAEAFLDFVVNKTDIRPDYMNNPRELGKIHAMIDELKGNPGIRVNRLDIIGYASPEGTLATNKRLSEGRAMALRNYLSSHYDFPRNLYHIVFGGENWAGLVKALEATDLAYKNEVLTIIETTPIEKGRELKIMQLQGGNPYRYLLKHVFPSLRVAICKVGYTIKNYSVEEAREEIKKRPCNLSLNEMFLVANTYPAGSQEFTEVFETAARIYPDNDIANLNAAGAALSRHDLTAAQRYLERVKATKHELEYHNIKGVLALLNEEYQQAETLLRKAAEGGLPEAKLNMSELNNKKSE